MADCMCKYALCLFFIFTVSSTKEVGKEKIDKLIEDEITLKLSDDLLQSIEKKFHVDLEKSVDSVLNKIKLLLQNGTMHIQDRLMELQKYLQDMRDNNANEVDKCLLERQNETTALAENALHQMVVCGYALIGHDPAQAIRSIVELKTMIKHGLKPVYEERDEINNLLKVCGHEHNTLKTVIRCVISKSPQLKSAMMAVSSKLIDGVVHLTKQMAHGAMHEACLIEVINKVEKEAFILVNKVKLCSNANGSPEETVKTTNNNATMLDDEQHSVEENEFKKNYEPSDSNPSVKKKQQGGENNDVSDTT